MCKKAKGIHNRIDYCMKRLINWFESTDYITKACCCGHGKYPMTIVIEDYNRLNGMRKFYELLSGVTIPRTRNFYKKDKRGFYYIPELNTTRKSSQHQNGKM